MRPVLVIRAAAAFLFAAAPVAVLAAPQAVHVPLQGRNLSDPQVLRAIHADLEHAAADVCGGFPTPPNAYAVERFQLCYRETLAQAVAGLPGAAGGVSKAGPAQVEGRRNVRENEVLPLTPGN